MGFKRNVEALLSRRHWSRRELAVAAGISPSRISQILSSSSSPTLTTVTKIADAFGVDAADLMRDHEPRAPKDELEIALRHQGDLSSDDNRAVQAFISYIRDVHGKGRRHEP